MSMSTTRVVGTEVNGWTCIGVIDSRAMGLFQPVPAVQAVWLCSCGTRVNLDAAATPADHTPFHASLKRVQDDMRWHEEHPDNCEEIAE